MNFSHGFAVLALSCGLLCSGPLALPALAQGAQGDLSQTTQGGLSLDNVQAVQRNNARQGAGQQGPIAAPVGEAAQSADLAAPPGAAADASAPMGGSVDFSVVSMFLRADIIVKAVMILLLVASLWSWTIIFNKLVTLSGLKRKARRFDKLFWSGQSLDELYQQFAAHNDHPLSAMFIAALREWRRAFDGGAPREAMLGGVKERIDKAMSVTILRETDGIEKNLGILATIGSVSPFVGLFGTVWGIMKAFREIGLNAGGGPGVVAAGISEALITTAVGLLVAIPAIVAYNGFTTDIRRLAEEVDLCTVEMLDEVMGQEEGRR